MKELIRFLAILGMLLWLAHTAAAQTCPPDMVCLTKAAAQAALEAGDKAKALEAENKDLKEKVIPELKDALADIRVKYAEAMGKNSVLEQRAVSDSAEKALMFKMIRPKCGVLSFCVQ